MPHKDPIIAREYHREYREKNRDIIRRRLIEYRIRNKAKIQAMRRDEYLAHRAAYIARSRARWERLKDEINAKRRTPEYKEKKNQRRKIWWSKREPWQKRYNSGTAQAYDRNQPIGDTMELRAWYKSAFATMHVICAYCERHILAEHARVDHKQPARFGGIHEARNLAIVCEDCNKLKAATPWEVWSAYLEKKRGAKWQ